MSHLLTTDEVIQLTGIVPYVLRRWIKDGIIVPTQHQGRGRGRGDKFSPQANCGIATLAALLTVVRRIDPQTVKDVMSVNESMTEDEMNHWLSGEMTAWDEERAACNKVNSQAMDEEMQRFHDEKWKRIDAVLDYLKDRQQAVNRLIAIATATVSKVNEVK